MKETLLTAARRAVRFFNIDMQKGGIITQETQHAFFTLEQQIERETARQKQMEQGDGDKNTPTHP